MARKKPDGEIVRGLEIEIDGEIGEDGDRTQFEVLSDDPSRPARERRYRPGMPLPWRVAAWATGAALLGFGVGALGEPAAKHVAMPPGLAAVHLDLAGQPITAPGQAQMAELAGAAWSVSPVTPLVVHVVNDGPTTLHLHTGTLSGQHISHGTLAPDGTGVLAPGQSGTLTAQVTLECNSKPSDAVSGSAVRPLTADIPVSDGSGPTTTVSLVSGTKQDDLYIASQLCAGLPQPATISFQNVPGTAAPGGKEIRVTVHNITGQPIRYIPEFGFQSVDVSEMQVMAAGATIVVDVPVAQICDALGQSAIAPIVGLYMATMDGSYQTSYEESLDQNSSVSVCA